MDLMEDKDMIKKLYNNSPITSISSIELQHKKYRAKQRTSSIFMTILRLVILVSIGYIVIYPLLYMLSSSFKPVSDFLDPGCIWVPKSFTLEHLKHADISVDFKNSFISTMLFEISSAAIEVITCSVVAYGLARFKFRGKSILMVVLFLTIIIPDQMVIIPRMINYSDLDFLGVVGLIRNATGSDFKMSILDTGWSFVLPSLFAVGFRAGIIIFIYMQFFKGLPYELEEAAWMDGANLFQTYTRIALPSSSVVLTTVIILSVIWHWNDYYLAVMYLSENFPLAVKIANMSVDLQHQGIWNGPAFVAATSVGCLVFITPMLIMYIILQRKFVSSIDRVGITG